MFSRMVRKEPHGGLNKPDANTGKEENTQYKLGMFPGVFTPSILTILGIILFLRMGYTTGHAGLLGGLALVTIASLVSILTTASLSAIATNISVKGGGAYFLISRTLGVQFGGAIGLVLFLAQSVSIAFYCIGFGEATAALLPDVHYLSPQTIAMASLIFLFFLAWMGADLATKFQYVVMVLLVMALTSFFIGSVVKWETSQLISNLSAPKGALPFWVLFAIFFPAVTGFTQGVNMSGDLKDPGRAIPYGTFLAVFLSTIIYYAVVILFSGSMPNEVLVADYDAMKKVSIFPALIHAGVISATLSSAMASFLGSPRILQSIAKDKIFGFLDPFAKGVGTADNPRRGVLLSLLIAAATIGLGQLNLIASVVSMFFLISYALINYATFYESRTASPSFRPRFRWYTPWMSLTGFVICSGAILAIDIRSGIMAVAILMAVYQYLKQKKTPARWADSRRSNYIQRAKENLISAALEPEHDRDWRPIILAFTNNPNRMKSILKFSGWLEGRAGMTAAIRLIRGKGLKIKARQEEVFQELTADIWKMNSKAYPLVVSVSSISKALPAIVQSFGIGPIKANTALINWMDELGKGLPGIGQSRYAQNLRITYRQGLNLVILNADNHKWDRISNRSLKEQCIDVWWNNDATSRLMLLLAYLITRKKIWSKARLRVLSCESVENGDDVNVELDKLLDDFRIKAEPVIVPDQDTQTIIDMSSKSSLVLLPCRIRENMVLDAQGGSMLKLLPYLPMTAMVMAAQDIDLEADPDTGIQGELAMAEDELKEAQERYDTAVKESHRLKKRTQELSDQLEESPKEGDGFTRMLKEADQAIEDEEVAFRKAAKAKAKADDAARTLDQLQKDQPKGSGDSRNSSS